MQQEDEEEDKEEYVNIGKLSIYNRSNRMKTLSVEYLSDLSILAMAMINR